MNQVNNQHAPCEQPSVSSINHNQNNDKHNGYKSARNTWHTHFLLLFTKLQDHFF